MFYFRERLTRVVALKEGCREEEVELGEVEEAPAKENGEGFASELVKVHFWSCTPQLPLTCRSCILIIFQYFSL